MHSSHFISTSAQHRHNIIEVSVKFSNLLLYVYATRVNLEITSQVFHDETPLKFATIHHNIKDIRSVTTKCNRPTLRFLYIKTHVPCFTIVHTDIN